MTISSTREDPSTPRHDWVEEEENSSSAPKSVMGDSRHCDLDLTIAQASSALNSSHQMLHPTTAKRQRNPIELLEPRQPEHPLPDWEVTLLSCNGVTHQSSRGCTGCPGSCSSLKFHCSLAIVGYSAWLDESRAGFVFGMEVPWSRRGVSVTLMIYSGVDGDEFSLFFLYPIVRWRRRIFPIGRRERQRSLSCGGKTGSIE